MYNAQNSYKKIEFVPSTLFLSSSEISPDRGFLCLKFTMTHILDSIRLIVFFSFATSKFWIVPFRNSILLILRVLQAWKFLQNCQNFLGFCSESYIWLVGLLISIIWFWSCRRRKLTDYADLNFEGFANFVC